MIKSISLFIIILFTIPVSYSYDITESDQKIINLFHQKLITKQSAYIEKFYAKVEALIDSGKYNERIVSILTEINNNIELINTKENTLLNIDLEVIKNNWLDWNNQVRSQLWLSSYTLNDTLEKSAIIWSEQAKLNWEITHKRNIDDGFYNYTSINQWFHDNGIVCKNISWITHTENIWWWWFSCTDWECTDELSEATNRAFQNYMDEKWTDNDPHYRSIVQPYFTQIWLWISIEEKENQMYEYYMTIHYCTQFEE